LHEHRRLRMVVRQITEIMNRSALRKVPALIEPPRSRLFQSYGLPRLVRQKSGAGLQDAP
jgi:hypothetical protein